MIHESCRTYFNIALRACPHCDMLWCPRCRRWFSPPSSDKKEAGSAR